MDSKKWVPVMVAVTVMVLANEFRGSNGFTMCNMKDEGTPYSSLFLELTLFLLSHFLIAAISRFLLAGRDANQSLSSTVCPNKKYMFYYGGLLHSAKDDTSMRSEEMGVEANGGTQVKQLVFQADRV
ncbi:hypothetical protein PIB30_038346 [Stylosanthes scabra]|uniref:Uncharacterized protein n=1 Tax=Stylosanthes scabra TaxID=79078 RepID=A0ABU6YCY5_9FABA|nr:hypothetical protein [Stylosanthes scabra]